MTVKRADTLKGNPSDHPERVAGKPAALSPFTACLVGIPSDHNSSFERGAAAGPDAIRAALWSGRGNLASELGAEIGRDMHLSDVGDVEITGVNDADDAAIIHCISSIHASGRLPFALGGDHAISFPLVMAAAAIHGPVNILHIDAHPDLYDDFMGNPRSHASPFARIMERGLATRLVQIGIRTMNAHSRDQAQRFGVEIIPMAGFTPATVPLLSGPLYISIDLDGIDPAEAPGVAHPEPGGLTVREVLAVLHLQTAPVVGVDIVELNPAHDFGEVTSIVAAKLVRECMALAHRNAAAHYGGASSAFQDSRS